VPNGRNAKLGNSGNGCLPAERQKIQPMVKKLIYEAMEK
jgi:hypothetical protein